MQMRTLGDGPEISVVGFGAWEAGGDAWGPNRSDDEVIAAMHAGIDAGMTWIDTAEVYGNGRSEELVGRALAGRDDVLVFTKVAPEPSGSGFRPEQVGKALRASLGRLGRDHVDLYQLHWPDESIPVEETWGAMAQLVRDGLARHIGVSNFDRSLVERCRSLHPVTSVQNEFSLLRQDDRAGLLPWLAESGIGYLAYSPLAAGLLTGALDETTTFEDSDWRSGRLWGDDSHEDFFGETRFRERIAQSRRVGEIAERLGVPRSALALRAALELGVTAVIAGSRSPAHTRENAAAGDVRAGADVLAELDQVVAAA